MSRIPPCFEARQHKLKRERITPTAAFESPSREDFPTIFSLTETFGRRERYILDLGPGNPISLGQTDLISNFVSTKFLVAPHWTNDEASSVKFDRSFRSRYDV